MKQPSPAKAGVVLRYETSALELEITDTGTGRHPAASEPVTG